MLSSDLQGWKTRIGEWLNTLKQFRELLSSAKDVYGDLLGVDLDSTSVLSVILRNPLGTGRISRLGIVPLSAGVIIEDTITDGLSLVTAIKKMIVTGRINTKNAVISVPGSKVAIKKIKTESVLTEEDAEARAWQEARKAFPELIKSLFLDYTQITEIGANGNKKYFLVLVMSRKEDIAPRIESMHQAGLAIKIIDVDYYALERSYRLFEAQLPPEHVEKFLAIINFNPYNMTMVVMQQKTALYYTRQIYSGDALVPFVQKAMGMSVDMVKKATVASSMPSIQIPISIMPESDNNVINNLEPEASDPTVINEEQIAHLIMTIRRLFQSFYADSPGHLIEYIALTGRCALIPEVTNAIQKTMEIPVIIANPFAGLNMGEEVDKEKMTKLGPAFAMSCGLAMRGIPLWR